MEHDILEEFGVSGSFSFGFGFCVFIFKGRLWFPLKKNTLKKRLSILNIPPRWTHTKKANDPRNQDAKNPRCQMCWPGITTIQLPKKSEVVRNHQKNAIRASWQPKQTFLYGCFNWMLPIHYNKTGLFHQTSIFKEGLFVRYFWKETNNEIPKTPPQTQRTCAFSTV